MAGRPPTRPAPGFGARLAAARAARGLGRRRFAEALGISPDMLTYYERRAGNPSAEIVSRAAALPGVSAGDLLGRAPKAARGRPGPPSQIEERLSALRALPRDKQRVVLQLLDSFLLAHGKAP